MRRSLELGLIRIHVLAEAARQPIFGTSMLDMLRLLGYDLSYGTLYPMLHAMEREGLLQRDDRVEHGRLRKYYVATPAGHEALIDARNMIDRVSHSMTDGGHPFILPTGVTDHSLQISVDALRAWLNDAGFADPAVLDVRHHDEFRTGHLPGARHVPYEELGERLDEVERFSPIITYCMMRQHGAARSVNAAALLRGHGYQAWALSGGISAWEGANLPLEVCTSEN